MQESAKTARSYLWSHAREFGLEPDQFLNAGLHIHVPAGAIPKDGPSAGVTMTTALASLYSGMPARNDTAMTGEVTLDRAGAADRRRQGEGAGGAPRGAEARDPAARQPEGSARSAGRGPRGDGRSSSPTGWKTCSRRCCRTWCAPRFRWCRCGRRNYTRRNERGASGIPHDSQAKRTG